MRKILLVISREYFTRVKKPSFWLLTIIVPILLAALYFIPIYLATKPLSKNTVLVVDETTLFVRSFESGENVVYRDAGSLDYAKRLLAEDSADAIIHIPARETTIPGDAFLYYRSDAPSATVQSDVDRQLQEILRNNILLDVHNISAEDYALISGTKIKLHTKDLETGRDAFLEVKIALGILLVMIVYMTIFMFCSQVMRGVTEEKTSRIVEVIVCSVRPFQLMMGKVVGIAMVGLTQLLLWMVLSGIGLGAIRLTNADLFRQVAEKQSVGEIATKGAEATAQMEAVQEMPVVSELVEGLASINFGVIAGCFLVYFIFGYLLYASLFAACGALADNETDSQQFTLPLTVPLLGALLVVMSSMSEPSSSLLTWLSIIPFTSPVAMLFRIPFGVPMWQVWLSIGLLVASFPFCTWVAAKIYRGAILRYGQKFTWRSLFKLVKE